MPDINPLGSILGGAVAPYAEVVTAIANLATEAIRGQTPEQRAQIWAWYIEDAKFWRKLFGIGG